MKKLVPILLVFALLLSLSACGEEEVVQDATPLTMYIGLGNTSYGYYDKLHDLVLQELGVDLKYVYSNTLDTTTAMFLRMKNNDVPVDIVVTAMAADEETQRACLIDLAAYTSLPDLFTSKRVSELAHDGSVYQLPFSTRLIGFEYNRTLMAEMGWELPDNFDEMVALKEKCEAAGYLFALTGGTATGHGFNYLFHLMGSEYLGTPDGTEWYQAFMRGEADVSEFAEKSEYFERFVEAGLFGSFHDQDWLSAAACGRQRALFYYNILNDLYEYNGFRYNADGTLYGARYEGGRVVAQEDPAGNAVLTESGYVLYDESNPDHAGLTRYTIPGTQELHDKYGAMPWVTENGSGNCYTIYDNMYIGLNKRLLEPQQADRLETAKKVLAFMASDQVTDLFSGLFQDGYVAVNSFEIDDTRLYGDYAQEVSRGYLIHWYYNDFDNGSIVTVGQAVNDYIRGDATLQDAMDALQSCRDARLSGNGDTLFTVTETLDYEQVARLQAMAGAMSLQQKLDELGMDIRVNASLLPYTETIEALSTGVSTPVVQQKLYAGNFDLTSVRSIINPGNNSPQLLCLHGSELAMLRDEGYNGFSFVCMRPDKGIIDGKGTYYVAISPKCMDTELYNYYLENGKVVCDESGAPIVGSVEEGLSLYAQEHPTLGAEILWD